MPIKAHFFDVSIIHFKAKHPVPAEKQLYETQIERTNKTITNNVTKLGCQIMLHYRGSVRKYADKGRVLTGGRLPLSY